MTGGKGDPGYLAILTELRGLHLEKSAGYGTGTDPFRNFAVVGELKGQARFVYALDRLTEKVVRCHSLMSQGRFDELGEEFLDIASLSVCAEALRRED